MRLFGHKFFGRKVGRPVPMPPPTGDVQFATTTIYVRAPATPQPSVDYVATVISHLNAIDSFHVGRQFFQALSLLGKRQVIRYGGPNANQAAWGGLVCMKQLRRFHELGDNNQFANELQTTITASGHNKTWLAQQLYYTPLPSWLGNNVPSPFRNLRQPPSAPILPGQPRQLPKLPWELVEGQKVDVWLAGTSLPNYDELDILMLVLEPWLVDGPGGNTRIDYDPNKLLVGGVMRPPHIALFHELVHAYYSAAGKQLGREDSLAETNGGRLFELMAVGLAPFNTRPYSENQFRTALGWALRTQYP